MLQLRLCFKKCTGLLVIAHAMGLCWQDDLIRLNDQLLFWFDQEQYL